MKTFLTIAFPKFSLIALLFKKPFIFLLAASPAIIVAPVVDINQAWLCLKIMFGVDLVTGLIASYIMWKKSSPNERWFFGKGEGFSSDKFKKCLFKACAYAGTPFLVQRFQDTFLLKNIKYETVSEAEMGYATAFILVFCLNEGFSIFHENLPKCGFNIWQIVKKMLGFYKEVKKEITE